MNKKVFSIGYLTLFSQLGLGQSLEVDRFSVRPDGRFELDFRAALGSERESFALEGGSNLLENWTILGDASLNLLETGSWRATTDASEARASRGFFRMRQGGPDLIVTPFASAGSDLVIRLNQAFRGLLDYRVEFLDDQGRSPLSGQIYVNGTEFTIGLPNLSGSGLSLAISLIGAEGTFGRFHLGDGRVRTIPVQDNVMEWAGLLTPDNDGSELAFQVVIRDGQAAFLRTNASELFPPNPAIASGGEWPAATNTAFLPGSPFAATFGPISLAGGTDLAVSLDTELTLELSASENEVTETSMTGTFILETTAPEAPHLNFESRTGSFTLLQIPSTPSDVGL